MDIVIVYESAWGNTKLVAEAVAEGLSSALDGGTAPRVVGVEQAPPLQGLDADLLVVGAPTHAFGLSRPGTRQDAHDRGGALLTTGVREWLEAATEAHLKVATFDTHIRHAPGAASSKAAKRLRALGCDVLVDPEKFYVKDSDGPLLPGELDRARAWGAELGRRLGA